MNVPAAGLDALAERSNLTRIQLMLWIGQMLDPGVPLYNMALAFALDGPLDVDRFRRAFAVLVEGNEALRTVFEDASGIPHRRVLGNMAYALPLVDFTDRPDPEAAANAWMQARTEAPFDLRTRLFDVAVLRLADDRHVWFLNQHHLITDGWSVALVCEYLAARYEADGKDGADAPSFPDYADYVAFERDFRGSPRHVKSQAYWQEKSADPPPPARYYGHTPEAETTATVRVPYALDADRSAALRALVDAPGVRSLTPHLALYNVFATLVFAWLHRISGEDALAIGTPAHSRPTAAHKATVGVFIELFPFHAEVEPGETFQSLLGKVAKETSRLLRYAQPGTSDPAFSHYHVVLNYINATFSRFDGRRMRSTWLHSGHGDRHHHLLLQVHDLDDTGGFELLFDFNRAAFPGELQQTAIRHFLRLLDAFLADRDQPIHRPALLAEAEAHRLAYTLNDTTQPFPEDRTIVDFFEAQSARTPDRVALRFLGETVTFAALNRRANRLAHHLRDAHGIGPEARVAVVLRRSPHLLVAFLAVMKAGGAYVPIDPAYPAERVRFMLRDSGATAVLTEAAHIDLVGHEQAFIDVAEPRTASAENPPRTHLPGNLIYVMYTSGSTGQPKGVMAEHRAVMNRLTWMKRRYDLGGETTIVLKTPISFDVSVWELYTWMMEGGTLTILPPEAHKDAAAIIDTIERDRIEAIHFVPTMLQAFLRHLEAVGGTERLKTLRHVFASGEALGVAEVRRFRALLHEPFGIGLHDLYGPTEATVEVTYYDCCADPEPLRTIPIGRPVANTQVYILDAEMRPQPPGVPGDFYLGGVQVTRGYHGRAGLTAERFVPDPFVPGARLYRTGDRARWGPNDQVEFLGRKDHQVKLRGQRVELDEIAHHLRTYTGIEEAVVVMHAEAGAEPTLVAYLAGPAAGEHTALRLHLRRVLPAYMIPTHLTPLPVLPLHPNGKINRAALPPPTLGRPERVPYTAPRDDLEAAIAAIWADVLRLERVGIHDDFLALGGHSLAAIQIVARVNEAFAITVPIKVALDAATVAVFAAHVEALLLADLDALSDEEAEAQLKG